MNNSDGPGAAEARGNPLALLELSLPLTQQPRQARSALPTVLPLTRRLLSLYAARVGSLPEPSLMELLVLLHIGPSA